MERQSWCSHQSPVPIPIPIHVPLLFIILAVTDTSLQVHPISLLLPIPSLVSSSHRSGRCIGQAQRPTGDEAAFQLRATSVVQAHNFHRPLVPSRNRFEPKSRKLLRLFTLLVPPGTPSILNGFIFSSAGAKAIYQGAIHDTYKRTRDEVDVAEAYYFTSTFAKRSYEPMPDESCCPFAPAASRNKCAFSQSSWCRP